VSEGGSCPRGRVRGVVSEGLCSRGHIRGVVFEVWVVFECVVFEVCAVYEWRRTSVTPATHQPRTPPEWPRPLKRSRYSS